MQVFNWSDNQQREWNVALDFGIIRRVHKLVGVDMMDPAQSAGVVGLSAQRAKLGEVLWLLSEKQAQNFGITQDEFFSGLDSDALAEGFNAICEGFIFFSPIASRAAVRAAVETQLEALATTATRIAEAINSPESQAAIATAIDQVVTTATETIAMLGKPPSSSRPYAA